MGQNMAMRLCPIARRLIGEVLLDELAWANQGSLYRASYYVRQKLHVVMCNRPCLDNDSTGYKAYYFRCPAAQAIVLHSSQSPREFRLLLSDTHTTITNLMLSSTELVVLESTVDHGRS